jgi:SAM-dependent methyltransferase
MATFFRDHFSQAAPGYAQYRPQYPRELFEWIASESPSRHTVWDCGTGTGQAARGLAQFFDLVVASDASEAQLAQAVPDPHVRYVRCTAESAGLATASVDAVTVAQAVHWFDMPAFFREAGRVARTGGLVAAWTYGNPSIDPDVDRIVEPFYRDVVGAYWPPERRLIERMYEDVRLPFEPVAAPDIPLRVPMTLAALAGYVDTWSAVQRFRAATGRDPMPAFVAALEKVWGDPTTARTTEWPTAIRAGRVR